MTFKNISKFRTKAIVIAGFIVLSALSILGIFLIYNELIKFSKMRDTTQERKSLVIIGNTLASLYKVEGEATNLFSRTTPAFKSNYDALIIDVISHIDTLKQITNQPAINDHLDVVVSLLKTKRNNTWQLIQLLDSMDTKVIQQSVKRSVVSQQDFSNFTDLVNRMISKEMQDTVILNPEKKGLGKRLLSALRNDSQKAKVEVKKSTTLHADSVAAKPSITDTIAVFIDDYINKYDLKNNISNRRIVFRQLKMHQTNDSISLEINKIMHQIEDRERMLSTKFLLDKQETLKRSTRIVSNIGIIGLISVIVFLFLSSRSITNSQRYRKEVEEAKKYAENLLEARERLILTITHDIKAPLSSIIGFIELLSKNKMSAKEGYYLENMQYSAEHVLMMVKNLLDYHTLETNRQGINNMVFQPYIMLNDIYQSFLPSAYKKDITFTFKSSIEQEGCYSCDPFRIRQIVDNLLSNAIKFTPQDGTILFSSEISSARDKNILIISIKDSGSGMTEEEQKTIFEEFKRLGNATKDKVEGSGLGLAITYRSVKLLKGCIEVVSKPNLGSEFIVKIPLQYVDKGKNGSNPCPKLQKVQFSKEELAKNILFIDDDPLQLNLYSEILKQEGFIPTKCNDSTQALELLQKSHFDIVITDIQMPGMNGFELVERIRMATFDNATTIPVIALSASSNVSIQELQDSGFTDFLEKPFTSKGLLEMIQKYLGVVSFAKELNINSTTQEDNPLKGFDVLVSFADQDIEASKVIIQSFIDENIKSIKVLKCAFKQKDWDTIKNTSHKMLPLMRMISAGSIVETLSQYEKGHKPKADKMQELIYLVEQQIDNAKSYLSSLS